MHLVLRVVPGLTSLRDQAAFGAVYRALRDAADARRDLRVVHYGVQGNHMHLLVESDDAASLVRGVHRLEVRIARKLNRSLRAAAVQVGMLPGMLNVTGRF